STFFSQFPSKVTRKAIISALHYLGFKYVHEVNETVDILKELTLSRLDNDLLDKPVISAFCPAVVRLIQVKYPSLLPNLLLLKSPMDLTTSYVKKKLIDEGVDKESIGVFYVTPCAAKIAAVKNASEDHDHADGIINMNYLFNKVYRLIKQGECNIETDDTTLAPLSKTAVTWALTGGEISFIPKGRTLALDEIHNVSDFLEKIENDEIKNIDYLELRACDESCPGGILCVSNRFVTVDRQRMRADHSPEVAESKDLEKYKDYLVEHSKIKEVIPQSMDKLDNDIGEAMKKMRRAMVVNDSLPQVDCRICGYQTCKLFAEAVVNDRADVTQCLFVRIDLERKNKMTKEESLAIMKKVWGEKKMDELGRTV
ncbi:MAG: ferredoxin, partial [Bacteroidales bacterium]|nr:ferredoxin [Bacteroidales bacterium]